MKHKISYTLCLTTLLCGLASTTANARAWDFNGIVENCNALACSAAGIAVGTEVKGFLSANDNASGPGSTFGVADILDYGFLADDVVVGPGDGALDSATLTTDAAGELIAGLLEYTAVVDTAAGLVTLVITVDVTTESWVIETDFLGLGAVASGPGVWSMDADGDGLAAILDNCTEVANPTQRDTDADGIGNFCDADFDQNCMVNFSDLSVMSANFFVPGDLDTDLDGSGLTNFGDLGILSGYFFATPGPSGIPNVCNTGAK